VESLLEEALTEQADTNGPSLVLALLCAERSQAQTEFPTMKQRLMSCEPAQRKIPEIEKSAP